MNEIKDLCEFGGFRFDLRSNSLWRGDEFVALPPKSIELLKLLLTRNNEVVSKQEIFDAVWADTFVEEGVLTQNVYRLRQALGQDVDGKQLIENVARRGYRLTVPVSWTIDRDRPKAAAEINGLIDSGSPQKPTRIGGVRLVAISIGICVLALCVIGFYAYRSMPAESEPQPSVELKFTRLTDYGDVSYLTIAADGGLVAYNRGKDLYIRDLQTGTDRKVPIEGGGKIGCLQFAPDGRSIYFGTLTNRDERGGLFRIGLEGGRPVSAASDLWSGFSLSPDGRELAFVRKIPAESSQALIVKNLESGSERTLASIKLPEEFYWNNYPAWSADGKRLAMVATNQTEHLSRVLLIDDSGVRDAKLPTFRNVEQVLWNAAGDALIAAANDGDNFQIWEIDLADGSADRITNDLNSYLGIAASADRKKIVSRQRIYFSNIWVSKIDDLGNPRQVTEGTSRNDGLNGLAWVDEDRLVYTSNDRKIRDWNLWLLDTADGSRRRITDDADVQNDSPEFGPDRRTIYFASDRGRQRRIWRTSLDGGEPVQVTFGEDEAHQFPQISPDGKYVYFIIKSGRNSNIGRASLEQYSVQELSGRTRFVPGNFLALSPDGKFLAFQNIASGAGDGSPRMQVAVMSTENPDAVTFFEVDAFLPKADWSSDSNFFDFTAGTVKESGLHRRAFSGDNQISALLPPSQFAIFNFAWSPGGTKLAIARGQLLRDVVLLTDAVK